MQHHPLSDLEFGDTWTLADAMLEDKPMVLRLRSGLDSLVGHPQLGVRLRIVWEYEAVADSGTPSSDELQRINDCDDILNSALEENNHAIVAYSSTCDGLRQWIVYTSDIEESANRINRELPHDPPYPIELSADPDPDWSEYHDIKASMGL
jgi:hypothetical protein